MSDSLKWEYRFLALAEHVASWSKDPSRQVGAIIVRADTTIVSIGYNGFARGVDDAPERYEDRSIKYPLVVHAEVNAILKAHEDLSECTLFSTLYPCATCAAIIINAGIRDVVCYKRESDPRNAAHNMDWAETQFSEAGVVVQELPKVIDHHPV
jgi:dCMP deaminase